MLCNLSSVEERPIVLLYMLVDGFQDQHSLMTKYLTHSCDHVVDIKKTHVIATYMDLIQQETSEMIIQNATRTC